MAQHGIVMEYRIIKDGHPHQGELIVYYEPFDRYFREDEKVSKGTGISRDTVETQDGTYCPYIPEKIQTLFYVPGSPEREMKTIYCHSKEDYWKQVREIGDEFGWAYSGRCGSGLVHHWFDELKGDLEFERQENVNTVIYIEDLKRRGLDIIDESSVDEASQGGQETSGINLN